jgi:predicted nuclease of restriction endonuclease-like (RecB) superfamily
VPDGSGPRAQPGRLRCLFGICGDKEKSAFVDTKQVLNENERFRDHFKDPYFIDFLGLKEGYLEKCANTF